MVKSFSKGVMPAIQVPFKQDYSVDEADLRRYVRWLSDFDGIVGLVVNGHSGEIISLRSNERNQIIEIVVDEIGDRLPIISGVLCEGTLEAIDHAKSAENAGASGVLLMPPHHWLRFGKQEGEAESFSRGVASSIGIPVIVHQYPSWTRASYSTEELLRLAEIPGVDGIKMGTRDMSRWGHDFRVLKARVPDVLIFSCIDEYLLPTLIEGADGALVGLAGFVPGLVVSLVNAVSNNDLRAAKKINDRIYVVTKMVYRFGEPSGSAHQRMKAAMKMLNILRTDIVRPPLIPLSKKELSRVRDSVNLFSEFLRPVESN
ncbi:MAG: dihydrodipicolinate synthase family protein [Candidatus Bathyarchaeia archaeon]